MNWILFWLFLHVAAAIIAFGPSFVFPVIGSLLEKNPASAHFAVELMHKIETGLILPVAGTMLVSGIGLIFAAGINLTKTPWLGIGIILYLIAMGIAIFNQVPTTRKLIEATAAGPPPGAPPGPPPLPWTCPPGPAAHAPHHPGEKASDPPTRVAAWPAPAGGPNARCG